VYTRKKYPAEWAACQRELAAISAYMTKGNAVAIYRKAISHLEAALTVHTRAKFPEEWARDKVLMAELVKTSPLSNPQVSGKKAAAHLEEALRVYTEARYPEEWAGVQLKLATLAIGSPREGDPASEARTAGFRRAIELSNAALRVFTREEFPRDWSTTQATLGLAHSELRAGDRALNLTRAIEYFNAADEVIAGDDDPEVWALNQVNMGIAYRRLKDDKTARKHYQAALKVLTPEEYPDGNDLVLEHLDMLEKGVDLDLEPDPEDELKRLNARLNLYPEDKFPEKFAEAHFEMGVIEVDLMDKYDDNRRMHFALKHFESAARAYRTAGCAEEAKSASVLAQNLRAALKQAF